MADAVPDIDDGHTQELFATQFRIVKEFVYHAVCYRSLCDTSKQHNNKSLFWTLTINAHALQGVISWCKVFGSDKNNQVHHKKLSNTFDDYISQAENWNEERWRNCQQEMLAFRDQYAAHQDIKKPQEERPSFPHLKDAFEAVYHYDKWVRPVLYKGNDFLSEQSLEETKKVFEQYMTRFTNHLPPACFDDDAL